MYNYFFFWLLFDNKKYKGFKSMNKYVKSNVILFCFFLLPTHSYANEIDVPFEMAWERAIEFVLDEGGLPEMRDKELGIIRTDSFSKKLDKKTAHCGRMFGIPYISDKRTKTSTKYTVRLKKVSDSVTNVRVKVDVDGYFFTNETAWAVWTEKTRDADKVLQCKSTGVLEERFIDALRG